MNIKTVFLLAFVFGVIAGNAQPSEEKKNEKRQRMEEMQKKWKPLSVGQKMPDIPLGTVINNVTGKKRFSDFKGKLIILDFWNTGCTSCIAAFPHMAELQEKYKDKIQIFLVNDVETQKEIEERLGFLNRVDKSGLLSEKLPSNLPSIVSSKPADNILYYLFPPYGGTGYHVWIDDKGVVILRGDGHLNTYEEKIEGFLAGKEISYVSDEGTNKYNDGGEPLYLVLSKVNRPVVEYHSIITRLTDEIVSCFGERERNHIDSASGTVRNSFLTYGILDLYDEVFRSDALKKERSSILNRPSAFIYKVIAKDKTKYSSIYLTKPITDKWLRENAFNYEQIAPLGLDGSTRQRYMLEDLNRYFGYLYGAEGRIEKRKIPCWLIVRSSDSSKLPVRSARYISGKELNENGITFIQYGVELRDALADFIVHNEALSQQRLPIIDGSEIEGNVVLRLPKDIESIEAFRAALHSNGLDMVKGEIELSILVLQENGVEE